MIRHGIQTDIVELDPAVYKYATEYFGLSKNHTAYLEDAVGFIEREVAKGEKKYEYILHDVFTGGAVPASLFTLEVFEGLKALLAEDGVVAIVSSISLLFFSIFAGLFRFPHLDDIERGVQAGHNLTMGYRRTWGAVRSRLKLIEFVPNSTVHETTSYAVASSFWGLRRFEYVVLHSIPLFCTSTLSLNSTSSPLTTSSHCCPFSSSPLTITFHLLALPLTSPSQSQFSP